MGTFYSQNDYRNYLEHFGVKGMKWGVRRYQNTNGSYTSAGRKRYGVGDGQPYKAVKGGGARNTAEAKAARRAKLKKAAMVVGGAAALAGAGYLGAKYGRGALQAYRSGGWNVEGGGSKLWRDRSVRAAKFRTVNTGPKVPGAGDAIRRAAAGAASRAGDMGYKARGMASRAGQYAKNAATAGAMNARSMASRAGDMGYKAKGMASRAGQYAKNAATAGAMNARSMASRAGDMGYKAKGMASRAGQYAKNAGIAGAMNARSMASRAGAYARDAGNKARAGLERVGNTRVSPNVARAVNVGSAVVGGAAGIAAGRAARKAYEKRYGGNNGGNTGRSNGRKRRR